MQRGRPVLLWTDALVFLLLGVVLLFAWYARRREHLAAPWREVGPTLVVVDSVQTLRTDRVESAPGSVAQVRECAALLAAAAKSQGAALVLVGGLVVSIAGFFRAIARPEVVRPRSSHGRLSVGPMWTSLICAMVNPSTGQAGAVRGQ